MEQVAVRMTPKMHEAALKAAGESGESFGEFIRKSVEARLNRARAALSNKEGS